MGILEGLLSMAATDSHGLFALKLEGLVEVDGA